MTRAHEHRYYTPCTRRHNIYGMSIKHNVIVGTVDGRGYDIRKEGCKKDVVHDAFDATYVSCIDNRSRDFFV